MSVKWTENQIKAINSSGTNTLVSAAAGSGKTAVLVQRVIRMITDEKNPVRLDKILMVTFTNAAAAEMRTRIYKAISECIEKNPNNAILHEQLSLLGQAQITTIHAFCQNLLKDNFHKVGLSPDFTIVDEVVQSEIQSLAADIAIENAYDNFPSEMESLLFAYGGRFDDSKLKSLILALYKFIQCQPYPKEWLDNVCSMYNVEFSKSVWSDYLQKSAKDELRQLILLYDEAITLSESGNVTSYFGFLSNEQSRLNDCLKRINNDWDETYNAVKTMVFERMPKRNKESDETLASAAKSIRDSIKKQYSNILQYICAPSQVLTKEISEQSKLVLCIKSMVEDFSQLYSSAKKEKNVLDFDDLLHIVLERLLDDDEIKERFDEILVDEYQDTNAVNIAIFEKLSNGRNLFMVGDVKQSIYGFLNARPESFIERYLSYSTSGNGQGMKIPLSNNFRSADNIIYFINFLFERIMSVQTAGIDYSPDQRLVYSNETVDSSMPVEVHLLETNDAENENLQNDKLSNEAYFTAKRIINLVEIEKPLIYDNEIKKKRPIKYSDIAVLARSVKSDVATEFTRQFALCGIPVTCGETGSYLMTVEISTVIAFLQIIDNRYQDIPLIAVMRSPMFSFTENELGEIKAEYKNEPFYIAVEKSKNNKVIKFKQMLDYFFEISKTESLDFLIERIITDTGYYSFVGVLPNGRQRMANLKLLCRRAAMFEQQERKSIFEYISYIKAMLDCNKEYKTARTLSSSDNAVHIMTIHKSKGLEFPAVFVVQCGKRFSFRQNLSDVPAVFDTDYGFGLDYVKQDVMLKYPSIPKIVIKKRKLQKELAEEMRVLYVALTRAKNFLCIIGSTSDADEKCEKWSNAPKTVNSLMNASSLIEWIGVGIGDTKVIKIHDINDILMDIVIPEKAIDKSKIADYFNYDDVDYRLTYTYKYSDSVSIPSKVSVSELVHDSVMPKLNEFDFTDRRNVVSKAQKGTVIHFVMQNIDILRTSRDDISIQVSQMKENGIISETEYKAVDISPIFDFFESDIGKRMKKSNNVMREYSFCVELDAKDIFDSVGESAKYDKVLVQGAIDCFFEESDGYVIVDYKTGINRDYYKKQLKLYSMCLEKLMNKPVKQTIIYELS